MRRRLPGYGGPSGPRVRTRYRSPPGGLCTFPGRGGPTRFPPGFLLSGSKVLQLYRLQGYIRTVVHAFEVDLLDRGVGAGPRLDDGRPCPDDVQDPAAGGVEAAFALFGGRVVDVDPGRDVLQAGD